MPVGYTNLLLSAKQSRENQCNGASRLRKMSQKSSALSILFEMRRSPLQIGFATFAAKKPQPLCEIWIEKGIRWKGNLWPLAHNAKYNTQGRGVWERGGGRLLYTVFTWTRWNVSDMTICETHKLFWLCLKKETFTYEDLDPGDSRIPMMCRWNSQITSVCAW
jgi:hypothetical protein